MTYFGLYASGQVIAEYQTKSAQTTVLNWTKGYLYLGGRLLLTITPAAGEQIKRIEYHPNRLGTQLITNPQNGTFYE